MRSYVPSTDEERATELALRNSERLAAYFRKTVVQSESAGVRWHRYLREQQLLRGWRRNRPVTTPPSAA